MTSRPARRIRVARSIATSLALCMVLFVIHILGTELKSSDGKPQHQRQQLPHHLHQLEQQFRHDRYNRRKRPLPNLLNSLSLTQKQCTNAFPDLTQPIDDIVGLGPFKVKDTGDMGPLQGRIHDNKIYIINAQRQADLSTEMLNSRMAALHQLHRAIVTSPEPVPDTVFAINFQDQPFGTNWGYSRAANPIHRSTDVNDRQFLMPHFSFWAWKLPYVGSIHRAASAIDRIENDLYPRLADKVPKALWRGTTWFNSVHNPQLRQNLLAATRNKSWADVEALKMADVGDGRGVTATNAVPIEDFCRYKYVLHTEGVAYSGRFQFLQMCASVTITPPIQWLQHTTHLVKPVFGSELRAMTKPSQSHDSTKSGSRGEVSKKMSLESGSGSGSASSSRASNSNSGDAARERARKAWPTSYSADEANIVFVAPDWSDLEETIEWLEKNPSIAQGIAQRQRDLFVGGGYFSPAAEVCYWRALIRGWSKVASFDATEWGNKKSVSYEAFSLSNGD